MPKTKLNVGILFGGKSAEHEISLQSAKNVYHALDQTKYHPILIAIDKQGKWLKIDETLFLSETQALLALNDLAIHNQTYLYPESNGKLIELNQASNQLHIDVAFPVLHGPYGEDGTVQGLLKLANIPFIGSSVLGSAVGMDKDIMKRLLRDANLPIGKFWVQKKHDPYYSFHQVKEALGAPFFVKPANMGSSIGITKVGLEEDFQSSIKKAFEFDHKIIFEENIQGREIECSVIGNHNPMASIPGEIITNHEFYSYQAKYIDEHGAILDIPAKLPLHISREIQDLAKKTFQTLSCEGLARVDFFLTNDEKIIINEINTIPGFTNISMFPKLWQASGVKTSDLLDRLIEYAIERYNDERDLKSHI